MTSAQTTGLVTRSVLGHDGVPLTQVHHVVAGPVERPGVELQADDGEDDDGKEEEQSDVDKGTDSLGYGGYDDLETWGDKILRK